MPQEQSERAQSQIMYQKQYIFIEQNVTRGCVYEKIGYTNYPVAM
jgi:hypothetical protein